MQSMLGRAGTLILDSPAKAFLVLITLGLLLALVPSIVMASPGVSMDVRTAYGSYPPGEQLTGTIDILHDEFIPPTATLDAYIDNVMVATVPVGGLLPGVGNYSFPSYKFSYNLTSSGNNTWLDFLDQQFDYSIEVTGTCGDRSTHCNETANPPFCWADCGAAFCPTYDSSDPLTIPCDWSITYPQGWKSSSVGGSDGLKQIDDFSDMVAGDGLPGNENAADTVWTENTNTDPGYSNYNSRVTTTMRQECGGGTYNGWYVGLDGWVHDRPLDPGNWQKVGAHRESLIDPFDQDSLLSDRGLYSSSDIGGIYRDGAYQSYSQTEALNSAFWNGTTGEIRIYWYDDQSTYTITYLPPNGPMLCAYADYSVGDSENWMESVGPFQNRQTRYDAPFSWQHGMNEFPLAGQPKNCPSGTGSCNQSAVVLGAKETADTSGTVSMGFDPSTRTVSATTSSRELTRNYTDVVSLDDIPGIHTASYTGHVLRVDLRLSGQVLAMDNATFGICADADGDGYCSTLDGGGDCDDSDPNRYPGKTEVCNGYDDNCDGASDEGFFVDGKAMSSYCGGANGTACSGTWRCSQDGLQAICYREFDPGELNEVCGNDLDDDCDGEVDELMKLNGEPDCWCELGKRDTCGSNIGICQEGTRICAKDSNTGLPEWSDCRNVVSARIEACNRDDDDCDGVIDDVNGGTSITSSKCGCYGGVSPSPEVCNDIDDDCNGEVDDGVSCCTDGDTRECGTDLGSCMKGTQTCISGSWQTSVCENEIGPKGEICYNGEDENCDGRADEGCDPNYTCKNGVQDLNENGVDCGDYCPDNCVSGPFWMILAGVAILVLLGAWFFMMKQKD